MRQVRGFAVAVAALLLGVVCLAASAQAAPEDIRLFESRVVVGADGVLTVTEIITVNARGRQIRRGIFRDFPTRYREPSGLHRTTSFEILGITRNGQPEPYHTDRMDGGVRVYIGNEKMFIPHGVHTYVIEYRTDRQLRFFTDYDELFWNVTGNFWSFPIRHARYQLTLPPGAEALQWSVYTGRSGARDEDARLVAQTSRTLTFETTRALNPREGLSVAVAFPKGHVPEPTRGDLRWRAALDNAGLLILLAMVSGVLNHLIASWLIVGRDPPRQAVIPRFEPPRGMSAGALSYLYYRGFRSRFGAGASRAFIAALTSLGVKGRLRIDETEDKLAVEAAGAGYNAMSPDEQALDTKLMGGMDRTVFTKANRGRIEGAKAAFRKAITDSYSEVYYTRNISRVVSGVVFSVIGVVAFLAIDRPDEQIAVPLIVAGLFGAVAFFLVLQGIVGLAGGAPGRRRLVSALLLIPGLVISVIPIVMLALVSGIAMQLAVAAVLLIAGANVLFAWLMPAPSVEGQRLAEEIEGYRLYLSVAEAERFNMEGAPPVTVSAYERHLPYAIGLGVERQWSRAFSEALAAAGGSAETYSPRFYRGSNWSGANLESAARGLVSSVGSSVAGATPSSSSSGSGGGGFSGGGGGGGGGGGW